MIPEDIIKALDKLIKEDFISQATSEATLGTVNHINEYESLFTIIRVRTYISLNNSTLNGSYIKHSTVIRNQISHVRAILNRINPPDTGSKNYTAEQAQFAAKLYDLANRSLKSQIEFWLNDYEVFLNHIKEILIPDNKISITYYGIQRLWSVFNENYTNLDDENIKLLKFNLIVAIHDHHISLGTTVVADLLRIRHSLDNKVFEEILRIHVKALKEKINLLLKKIIYRVKDRNLPLYISYRANEESIINNDTDTGYFEKFDKTTKVHYKETDTSKEDLSQRYHKQITKDSSHDEFHGTAKFCKDILENTEEVEELFNKFHEKWIEFDQDGDDLEFLYNKNAYSANINYFANYDLSSHLSKFNGSREDFELVKRKIKKISDIQHKTNIKNYFPYYKASKKIADTFDEILQHNQDTTLIGEMIAAEKEWIQKAKDNIEWCHRCSFRPFQLPYEESCIEIPMNESSEDLTSLFSASSYVLPLDYELIKQKITKLEQRIYAQEYRYQLSKKIYEFQQKTETDFKTNSAKIASFTQENKSLIDSVQEDLKTSKIDYIAVLSIFGAIGFFTAGSTNVLINATSIYLVIAHIAAIGSTLAIFALVILIILHKEVKFIWKQFLPILVIGVISLGVTMWMTTSYKDISDNALKSSADTVIQKLKTDSIFRHEADLLLHKKIDSLLQLNQPDSILRHEIKLLLDKKNLDSLLRLNQPDSKNGNQAQ